MFKKNRKIKIKIKVYAHCDGNIELLIFSYFCLNLTINVLYIFQRWYLRKKGKFLKGLTIFFFLLKVKYCLQAGVIRQNVIQSSKFKIHKS